MKKCIYALAYALNFIDGAWYVRKMYITRDDGDYYYAEQPRLADDYDCSVVMCLFKKDEDIEWSFSKKTILKILNQRI